MSTDATQAACRGEGGPQAFEPERRPSRGRKRLWTVAKWSLTLLVVGFVIARTVELWREGANGDVDLHAGWLLLAGLLYTAGWAPSAWFWKLLLARMGDEITWPAAVRAYYCGHLGKYVPGKALVPVIRGHLASEAGGRFRAGALAAVYETLLMMGIGAVATVGLAPFLVPEDALQLPARLRSLEQDPAIQWAIAHPWFPATAALLVTMVSIPLIGRLFAAVAGRLAPVDPDEPLVRAINAWTICGGFAAFCIAWSIHGLALWATLRGVGVEASLRDVPVWTACVALPTVAGFVAIFAPGGVGVREGLLIEVLRWQPVVDPRQAVAAAFLLRLVGLLAEVVVAVVLYYGIAAGPPDAETNLAGSPPTV